MPQKFAGSRLFISVSSKRINKAVALLTGLGIAAEQLIIPNVAFGVPSTGNRPKDKHHISS